MNTNAPQTPDEYRVIGHPVAHSLSPRIHQRFAQQTGQLLHYQALCVPPDELEQALHRFFVEQGGRGANITVPFKTKAYKLAQELTPRARQAGAVNTLSFKAGWIYGDNTDGAGLVRDLSHNLGIAIRGQRILILGAGGAAHGVIAPLLDEGPSALILTNRTPERAYTLAARFSSVDRPVLAYPYERLAGRHFDLVINATSVSLDGQTLPIPDTVFAGCYAYDMMYRMRPGKPETSFLRQAKRSGAERIADGLGMLVEQAAEAFFVWRGIRPDTAEVLAELRASG